MFKNSATITYAICALLIIAFFSIDILMPLGVAGGVPYITVILVSLWQPKQKMTIYFAVICTLVTVLGFFLSPSGGELWKVIFNRSLAIFAIWVTAILAIYWIRHKEEIFYLKQKIEKEKIYLATIHGSQHVIYNLLNELQLVMLEIEKHPEFDREVYALFSDMLSEAKSLMDDLSSVDSIEADLIRKSVHRTGNA